MPLDSINSLARRMPRGQRLLARWMHPMSMSEGQSQATLKLRAFIDAVLAIAWSALPDGSLDFVNKRFRDYTGLPSEQLTGWEWKSAVHPDDIHSSKPGDRTSGSPKRLAQR